MKKQIVSLISLSIVLSSVALKAQQKRDSLKEKTIDEVVLVNVGYGTQKKSVVTGAISKVTSKDLEKIPNGGVGQMIQGHVAGVTVAMNSGAPGSGSTVRVRGITTFGSANDPLWVVDGVPLESSDIATINQADVESVEVLKDAASAAIYGTRAAKGVILITTKKGRKGRISVSYNGYTSYSSPSKVLKLLNATEYAVLMNEKSINGGGDPIFTNISSLGVGTDWQKQVFNKSAFGMNHELSFSGGNDVSDFYLSFGLQDQDGIVATDISNYKKKTFRVNSNHKFLNNMFTVGQSLFYTNQKNVGIGNTNSEFGGVLSDAIMFDPTVPTVETDPIKANAAPYTSSPYILRDANGNPYGMSSLVNQEIVNPLAYIKTQLGNYGWSDVIIGNAFLQAEPIKGLKFKSTFGGKKAFWGSQNFSPLFYLNQYTSNTVKNTLSRGTGTGFDWYNENTLTYDKQLGDHSISVLLGQGAYVYGIGNYVSASHSSLPTNNWWEASFNMDVPESEKKGYSYNTTPLKRTSLFARVNYNYQEKYLFTGIIRRDGSSLFGPDNKYGVFPSASLGWVISKENFWPENPYVNSLKIRTGYGVNGNDGSLSPNQYESLITGGYNYTIGSTIYIGNAPATLSNDKLHWEETTQTNIGIDAKLFRNFNLTAEYFKKVTTGILRQFTIPGYVGVSDQPWGNVADMENKGFELELSYRKSIHDVNINIAANVATLQNTVTNIGTVEFYEEQGFQSMQGALTRLQVGHPYGSFYGYKTNGIFQNFAEISNYKNSTGTVIQPDAKPGDFKWVDLNNDGKIDANDRTFLGNSLPKVTFGFTLNVDYKNFDLSAFFQGATGNKIFQGLRRLDIANANYQTVALSRWTGEGTSNDFPRLTSDDTNGNFSRMSDFYLQDGSYLRLKLLSLGYSLPKSFVKNVHAEKVRIYVSGSNLVTFTKYTGYDPEIGGSVMGIDRGYYPQPRTLIFGLNLQF